MRTYIGLGSGIAILSLSTWFIALFTEEGWLRVCLAVIVTAIVYFQLVFPHASVIVPANKAWVLANKFIREKADVSAIVGEGFRRIFAQKEYQAGFHWKYFWESFVEEVDMKREIPVKGDPEEPYTLSDRSIVNLEYQVTILALPGRVVNYLKTRDEDKVLRVRTRAEGFLQGYLGRLKKEDVGFGKDFLKVLQAEFEKLFGGPGEIDPEEEELGIWTGTPEVFDISEPKVVEAGRNFREKMKSVIATAADMVTESKGQMSHAEAFRIAAIVEAGGANANFVDIAGLVAGKRSGGQRGGGKKGGQGGSI